MRIIVFPEALVDWIVLNPERVRIGLAFSGLYISNDREWRRSVAITEMPRFPTGPFSDENTLRKAVLGTINRELREADRVNIWRPVFTFSVDLARVDGVVERFVF